MLGAVSDEDFVDELMQIRRATEALDVIRNLTRDIRDASDKLKTLIGGIKPPMRCAPASARSSRRDSRD